VIQIPALAGVPEELSLPKIDPAAARCALALAGDGPVEFARIKSGAVEHAVLQRELAAWFDRARAGLEIFPPHMHVLLNRAPACDCAPDSPHRFAIWIGNENGEPWATRWTLERRFKEIAQLARGLPQCALNAISHAHVHAIPVLLPREALGMASFAWWMGEADERYVDEEYMAAMGEERESGAPTRKWFDKVLPPEVTLYRGVLTLPKLERLAERHWSAEAREIARASVNLWHTAKGLAKRKKVRFHLHRQEDDLICVGFGATLRWNARDPMARAFDDYANGWYESHHVEEMYGWIVVDGAGELRAALAHLEASFALARDIEKLIQLIAVRSRE
jgi:PRTRC genetic system protein F